MQSDIDLFIARALKELAETLIELRTQLATLADARSSVELKTSQRGVDVTVKAYAGSDPTEAGDAAMHEFLRVERVLSDLNKAARPRPLEGGESLANH